MTDKLTLSVYRNGGTRGSLQLVIEHVNERGTGDGYRLAGPSLVGASQKLLEHTLTEEDAAAIRRYLDAVFPQQDAAAHFEIDHGGPAIACPDCDEMLWLDSDEAPTLGDVIKVANAHKCEDADAAAG